MKLLNEIKQEIARREKELNSLVDAANLIASLQSGRGRKVKITSKIASILSKTGTSKSPAAGGERRGRPKGSKNKPGAKKTGPKKDSVASQNATPATPAAPKVLKKRGRKPGSGKAKATKAAKAVKA